MFPFNTMLAQYTSKGITKYLNKQTRYINSSVDSFTVI